MEIWRSRVGAAACHRAAAVRKLDRSACAPRKEAGIKLQRWAARPRASAKCKTIRRIAAASSAITAGFRKAPWRLRWLIMLSITVVLGAGGAQGRERRGARARTAMNLPERESARLKGPNCNDEEPPHSPSLTFLILSLQLHPAHHLAPSHLSSKAMGVIGGSGAGGRREVPYAASTGRSCCRR